MQQDKNTNAGQGVQVVRSFVDDHFIEGQDGEREVSVTDIIPYSALSGLLEPLRDGTNLPIHEQFLVTFDKEQRELLADAYYGQEPRSLKAFAGRDITVYGMILFEVPGGWKGKDQLWHEEGYFQVRMLVQDSDAKGEPIVVVKSSGAGLSRHVYHILNNKGWFLFENPQVYHVSVGEDNAHRITNVSHDLKRVLKGKVKV